MNQDDGRRFRLWEQHGQTILLGVITAALAYAGNAMVEAKAAQAAMAVEIKSMSNHLSKLEGAVIAMQAQYVTRAEFAVHEQRIQAMEAKR